MRAIARKIEKSLKTRGVSGTAAFCCRYFVGHLKNLAPRSRRSLLQMQVEDAEFDRQHGVDTGGWIALSELQIESANWIYGNRYQALGSQVDLAEILAQQDISYPQFTFIDLGSGKGRALLRASALPFRKIVGVEFSDELARTSRDNIRRWPRRLKKCDDISVLCMDAADYCLPPEPLVLFMYNPFGPPVMQRVLNNLRASHASTPRRIVIVYFTPKYGELLDQLEFLKKVRSQPGYSLYDTN